MTIKQTLAELLEFYTPTDLLEYASAIIHHNWTRKEAWDWLRDNTIRDYVKTEITPNIDKYIKTYEYIQEEFQR